MTWPPDTCDDLSEVEAHFARKSAIRGGAED